MDDFPIFNRAEVQAQTRDSLASNLRAALDDAQELVRLTAEQAGDELSAVRTRAQRTIAQARTELERVEVEALQRSRAVAYGFDDYIHHHPWHAIALAGVISTVIGVLVSRR